MTINITRQKCVPVVIFGDVVAVWEEGVLEDDETVTKLRVHCDVSDDEKL